MNIKHKYKSILFIPNHLNDGISAMEIFDDLLLVGTYMGYTKLGYINPKSNLNNTSNKMNNNCSSSFIMSQITTLTELEAENISCVGFEGRQYANIGIGDYEILKIDISKEFNSDGITKIKNYPNENEHLKYCEKCMCFMTNNYFLKVNTDFGEDEKDYVTKQKILYDNRNLKDYTIVTGLIEMTNYSVPFDFDGDRFVWLDNLSKNERRLCIFFTLSSQTQINIMLDKKYGHISHIKLLPNNQMFIVRNNNRCEIRTSDPSFSLIYKYIHIGNEVIASAVYIEGSKLRKDLINNSNCNNSHHNDLYLKINNVDKASNNGNILLNNNVTIAVKEKESEMIGLAPTVRSEFKLSSTRDIKEDIKYSIATLDYDGNVNLFKEGEEKTLFNMYSIKNIDKKYKEKEFFSIGFPYYITYNAKYYAIATDHGVFVIEKE